MCAKLGLDKYEKELSNSKSLTCKQTMKRINPKYVLKNYMKSMKVCKVRKGDTTSV